MKIKRKILIVVIIYLVALVTLVLGTNYHIENKTKKLWLQASERFENFFKYQNEFVDTRYANRTIRYSKTTNPEEKPSTIFSKDLLDTWNEKHSDIYKYFKIDDPTSLRDEIYSFFDSLEILGRIYIAPEGINAQISVPEKNWRLFLKKIKFFVDVPIKTAIKDGLSFLKLVVKVKKEIVK